jgi:hypothetical protein
LLAFLRGVLENQGAFAWCFDGENVVERMVKMETSCAYFDDEKHANFFDYFF